ncbi:MAG: ArnT family glycosyltransferase [Saprospiraceae bacterium]
MKLSISKIKILTLLAIPIVSVFLHWKVLNLDLVSIHVWRQTQTQNTIQSFYEEDFNLLNPRRNNRGSSDGILRMEFPIMQWIFAGFFKTLGNHLIISRLLSLLIGFLSILGIYFLSKEIFKSEIAGLLSAWFFNFSPSFFYHTVNPMPDNLAMCFAIWGLVFFFLFGKKLSVSNLIWSGIFLSLAALTKLPFILFVSVPFVYHFLFQKKINSKNTHFAFFSIYILQLLPLAWYVWVIPTWKGNEVAKGMFINQESFSDLFAIISGNLISTLPELLLNYAAVPLFLFGIFQLFKLKIYQKKLFPVFGILLLGLIAYFLFEMNLIGLIHDYYLFPFLPLLFLMVGFGGFQLWKSNRQWAKNLVLVAILIAPLTAHLRIASRWNLDDVGFNKDFLTYKNDLQNAIPDDALCVIGNDVSGHILSYYIHKKGWIFKNDNLTKGILEHYILDGATYLYSDSDIVNSSNDILELIDSTISKKGSIHIYKLKSLQNFEK